MANPQDLDTAALHAGALISWDPVNRQLVNRVDPAMARQALLLTAADDQAFHDVTMRNAVVQENLNLGGNANVDGNLIVRGHRVEFHVSEVKIDAPAITLNAAQEMNHPMPVAGILVDRGSSYASLLWDEQQLGWTVSPGGSVQGGYSLLHTGSPA